MTENLIVLGELHQDLYYETDFFEQIVEKIVNRIFNFIRYNPDDLMNRRILERLVKGGINDTPKKVEGNCFFKRGGNGNNSSEYLAGLGIPTKLMSIIGRGSEWMYPELKDMGINTDAIFQIDEITPVSTIIKSKFTTKIYLAPNLKDKMNFEGREITDKIFDGAKLVFSTPIAEKFIKIFEKATRLGIITAFNIETQKVKTLEEISQLIRDKHDLFFLNLKDAKIILNDNVSVEEIERNFKKFARIRIYTAGKDGSHIITDNFKLFFPGVEIDAIVDRTGAGDCYAAGFLAKFFIAIKNKEELDELLKSENSEKLKKILEECGKYGTYAAIYKITKQIPPKPEELRYFMDTFKIK